MQNTNAKITRTNVLQLWASKFPGVDRWLTHLQKKEQSALYLYRYCQWAHKTPPELLALKEADAKITPPPNEAEKLLDEFCGADLEDFTNAEKYGTAIQVRSFFKWSYRSLEKASGVMTWEKEKPYNSLSKEGLRKLYNRAFNPRDRALIPFVTCTGIAKETLSNLLWGHLEPDWETKEIPCINLGPDLLKGHGKGKYKGVRQITFLTPEAKSALLTYKEWIEDRLGRKLTPQDHTWLQTLKPYEPLSYAMLGNTIIRLSDEVKVPFSLHDGRRWVNTALEQIGISSNWARKIRGRKVRGEEAPYSQPAIDQLRAKFREAVPLLEFTSETSSTVEDRLKAVEKVMESMTPEQRDLMQRHGIKMFSKTEAAKRKERKEQENCTDGEHCQQIVSEENLGDYLSEGWRVVATLPSGKIVVDR
jgi:hypothetical protein